MTNKPNAFTITSDHFARARADIARRRKQLDAELAGLEADEETAAAIAKRYPEDASAPPTKPGVVRYTYDAGQQILTKIAGPYPEDVGPTSAKPTKKAKRPNTGRPYKPNENKRIVAAERGTLEALAEALGRDYPGVLKHHEVLLKRQRKPEKTDTPAPEPVPEMEKPQGSQAPETATDNRGASHQHGAADDLAKLGSENAEIVEATPAPTTASAADHRPPVRIEKGGHVPNSEGGTARPTKASGVSSASTPAPDTDPAALFDAHHSGGPHELAEAARELAAADGRRARLPPAKPGVSVTGKLMDNGPTDRRVY